MSALSAVSMKIGQAMYKGGEAGAASEEGGEPEAKEAEYEEEQKERRKKVSKTSSSHLSLIASQFQTIVPRLTA